MDGAPVERPNSNETQAMTLPPRIIFAGGVNLDTTLLVRALPTEGQSVSTVGKYTAIGGKGLNQALAAQRAGARVAIVGATGDDDAGRTIRAFLAEEGINIEYLVEIGGAETGRAIIVLDPHARNLIVGELGANLLLEPDMVHRVEGAWGGWDRVQYIAANGEAPVDLLQKLFDLARSRNIQTVWNPSPMPEDPEPFLRRTDVLIVNRSEAEELAGTTAPMVAVLDRLHDLGPSEVIVTLGENGCIVGAGGKNNAYPARAVDAVDPTGAGDTFLGYFLASRTQGASIGEAAEIATVAASICVETNGAAKSIPRRGQVDSALPGTALEA